MFVRWRWLLRRPADFIRPLRETITMTSSRRHHICLLLPMNRNRRSRTLTSIDSSLTSSLCLIFRGSAVHSDNENSVQSRLAKGHIVAAPLQSSAFGSHELNSHKIVPSFDDLDPHLHCESKKQDTKLQQILTDFQIFFTGVLRRKFATKLCLNIPPRLKCVATVPCEI